MAKPTIVVIHGAWHSPEFFKKVIAILAPLGYKCVTPQLPAVGRSPPVTSLDEDIATVRNTVLGELELGNDVVVNAHSWGAVPTTSGLSGLSKTERGSSLPGVVHLAFCSAWLLPENMSIRDYHGSIPPHWGTQETISPTNLKPEIFYNGLPDSEASYWFSSLRPQAMATFLEGPKGVPAYRKIPVSYLICELDRAVPVATQEKLIEMAREDGAEIEVERVKCGHSPYLVVPEKVADFLRRAAGERLSVGKI